MPKIVDHDARRVEYADAAMRVAIRGGVEALTVRSVSSEAGCSTGALSHYFKTKDELLIAVQRAAGERSLARIDDCFRRLDGRELLEAVIMSVLPTDEERRGEWRLWLAYFARAAESPELAKPQSDAYRGWRDHLKSAFSEAFAPGQGGSRSRIDLAVDSAMAMIQGLGVLGMFGPAAMSARRQRQVVREHLDRWLDPNGHE